MSKQYKIYTAGKMGGLTLSQQMTWRKKLENEIRERTAQNVTFIHPPEFYRYDEIWHKSEQEVMQWDLSQIRDSDIVAVDLSTIGDSAGTLMELGFLAAMNQFGPRHVHVIGIGTPNTDHPWIPLSMMRMEQDVSSAADYISNYLLV